LASPVRRVLHFAELLCRLDRSHRSVLVVVLLRERVESVKSFRPLGDRRAHDSSSRLSHQHDQAQAD